MSQENVELIRRAWEATFAEDWPTVLGTLHPDAEIRDFDVPDTEVYRGHEGFFRWLRRWNDAWESWHVEDLDVRSTGNNRGISLFRMVARGEHSGLELERRDAIVYRIEDGLIVYMAYYNDQAQAREAIASGEQSDN
jgi:ketosteroid isomerase-like protein